MKFAAIKIPVKIAFHCNHVPAFPHFPTFHIMQPSKLPHMTHDSLQHFLKYGCWC
jgi:hypothetical protein